MLYIIPLINNGSQNFIKYFLNPSVSLFYSLIIFHLINDLFRLFFDKKETVSI